MINEIQKTITITINLIKTFKTHSLTAIDDILQKHSLKPSFELLNDLEEYERKLKKDYYTRGFLSDMAERYNYPDDWEKEIK